LLGAASQHPALALPSGAKLRHRLFSTLARPFVAWGIAQSTPCARIPASLQPSMPRPTSNPKRLGGDSGF